MAPPQRRGGGDGRGGSSKGGGRGGGGRGSRGGSRGPRGGGANAESSAAQEGQATVVEGGSSGTRIAKPKPQRKPRGHESSRSGGTSGATPARPARALSIVRRKVLIRNIPYDWDEDKLAELVVAHGATREHMWRFVPGKLRSNNRAPRPGRLYLDFKRDTELAKSVIEKFQGNSLSDSMDETKLEVDFAPFQKIPREKQRKDGKVGTIDRDPDFVAFLEALTKPKEKLPSADIAAESKDPDGGSEKPVAALVQFLNERKRDKKGKFAGKSTEKSRGSRTKSAKEGKGTKEKSKSAKGKAKATEPTSAKDTAKPRKTRGKISKEKVVDNDQVEPGAIKIMVSKGADNCASRTDTSLMAQDTTTPDTGDPASKGKFASGKSGGGKGSRHRTMPAGSREPSGDAAPTEANVSSKESGSKGSGRSRRDSRASKGPKGSGRGEQPKRVFAPKVTQPAG